MTRPQLLSPTNHYRPEVLLLAPEAGEDANTLSLVAQCLELGLSIELDEHWRLPTTPPRDLTAYKTCLFPDSARARYDADLTAYQRAGGFLIYTKYYPVSRSDPLGIDHCVNPVEFQGRDILMFHLASMLLQAGLTQHDPDFTATMRARPLLSILNDQQAAARERFANLSHQRWSQWKDPDCIFLLVNLINAVHTGDAPWLEMIRRVTAAVAAAHEDLLDTDKRISSQLQGIVEGYVLLFAWYLMNAGTILEDRAAVDAGVVLGRFWFEHNAAAGARPGHAGSTPSRHGRWAEDVFALPGLHWLTRVTGDDRYAAFADDILLAAAGACQRPTGIWSHWVDHLGRPQSAWCRATAWPLFSLGFALDAVDPDSSRGRTLRQALDRTLDGLAAYQDPRSGLWRNVIDEPFTRGESSGTSTAVMVYDHLRELGLGAPRHQAMIDRAFEGLMPLCYRHGISAFCRGTDYGGPDYYRSRPLGYSPSSSFFAATVSARLDPGSPP